MNRLLKSLDAINEFTGRGVAWLALAMVLVQFGVVVFRYVFGIGYLAVQDSIIYMHGVLFMAAAGYTLLNNEHVRVDIFYRDASVRRKAFVDLFGSVLFLLPMSVLIWWTSWPYVTASWSTFEGSREISGLGGVFLLKSVIPLFAALLAVQGVTLALRSAVTLIRGEDGRRPNGGVQM